MRSSARASSDRSSARRCNRRSSASTVAASSAALVRPGWARATSACWRMAATGERSSWEASETSRRWRAWARLEPSSMRFMVLARRPISSSAGGSGTRRCSSLAEMASTSARIASTGASARPTTHPGRSRHHRQQQRQPDRQQPGHGRGRLGHGLGGPDDHHRALARRCVGASGHGQELAVLARPPRRRRPRPRPTGRAAAGPAVPAPGVGAGRDHLAALVRAPG